MTDECAITPGCGFGRHEAADHPCGQPVRVGDPCAYCGKSIEADPEGRAIPCPDCWTPLMFADAKAVFAEVGLTVDLRRD